jgi:antitoxin component YwqK of YwqJK toxin-antitoxin module
MAKQWLVIFLLLFIPLVMPAQKRNPHIPSTTKIYNEEGKVQMLISYNPACSCKVYSEFFNDGKLYAKRTFKITETSEIVDGEDVTYFYDGSIKIYRLWQDALPVGRFYFNHDNGKLEHEEFYTGKYKSGTWKYYDAFGRIVREQIYEPDKTLWNSKKDDATYKYYINGALSRTEKVTKGAKKIDGKNVVEPGSTPVATTDGKTLYNLKCKACHTVDTDGYGPALKNFNRKKSDEWLTKWIKDAKQLAADGDKDAIALFKQWNNKKHPVQDKMTTEQIQAILKFLKL